MNYDLAEHRHRFAIWAAARAAQRGFTTVGNLRDALEATDIREVLSDPDTLHISATQFDALHQGRCSSICSSLSARQVSKVTHGRGLTSRGTRTRLARLVGRGPLREIGTAPQDPNRRYFAADRGPA